MLRPLVLKGSDGAAPIPPAFLGQAANQSLALKTPAPPLKGRPRKASRGSILRLAVFPTFALTLAIGCSAFLGRPMLSIQVH